MSAMASGIPTAHPTISPMLFFFSGVAGGEGSPVEVEAAGWVTVFTMVVGPAVPVDTVVESDVSVLAAVEEASLLDSESLVTEAELDAAVDAAVEDGDLLPLPLALPVMEAKFGALDPVLPPIVPYALGSCSAKKGRGSGFSWQQSTVSLLASQHHWLP